MTGGTRPLVWRPDLEKVLIVHESAAFRAALRCQLSSAGFNCIEAGDVLAGLQRAVEDRPDALIIDAVLGGLDGSEMRSLLASDPATRHLPVHYCEEGDVLGEIEAKAQEAQLLWSESRATEPELATVRA